MIYSDLYSTIRSPLFTIKQVNRVFSQESPHVIRMQLSRFVTRGLIDRIKQGVFVFNNQKVDELVIASALYQPSYVSLETALSLYSLIPEYIFIIAWDF